MIDKRLNDVALQLAGDADEDPPLRQLGRTVTDRFQQLARGGDGPTARAALYLRAVDGLDQPGVMDKLEQRLGDTALFRQDVERGLGRIDDNFVQGEVRKVKDRAAADPDFRKHLAQVLADVTPTGGGGKGDIVITEYPPKEQGVTTDWVAVGVIAVIIFILL